MSCAPLELCDPVREPGVAVLVPPVADRVAPLVPMVELLDREDWSVVMGVASTTSHQPSPTIIVPFAPRAGGAALRNTEAAAGLRFGDRSEIVLRCSDDPE
jgi:hypothetical protein